MPNNNLTHPAPAPEMGAPEPAAAAAAMDPNAEAAHPGGTGAPALTPSVELPAPTEAQQRAAARKALQQKLTGHATTGASGRFYPNLNGTEAVAPLPLKVREACFASSPIKARGVTALTKVQRSAQAQLETLPDGTQVTIKAKPRTLELGLATSLTVTWLKPSKRALLTEAMLDLSFAPLGLSRDTLSRLSEQLNVYAPRHLIEWQRNCDHPYYQDLRQECAHIWDDPVAAGLTTLSAEDLSAVPTAKEVSHFVQALLERRALLPEGARLCVDDVIRPLLCCNARKLRAYVKRIQHLLTLSSREFIEQLLKWSSKLPELYPHLAWIAPDTFEYADSNIHKMLADTVIVPKAKQTRTKRATKSRRTTKAEPSTTTASASPERTARATAAPNSTATTSASASASAEATPASEMPLSPMDHAPDATAAASKVAAAPDQVTCAAASATPDQFDATDTPLGSMDHAPEATSAASEVAATTYQVAAATDQETCAAKSAASDQFGATDTPLSSMDHAPDTTSAASEVAASTDKGACAAVLNPANKPSSAQLAAALHAIATQEEYQCSAQTAACLVAAGLAEVVLPEASAEDTSADDGMSAADIAAAQTPTQKLEKCQKRHLEKQQHKRHLKRLHKQRNAIRRSRK
ncbi:MAG TPA: hypothetical protein H9898_03995 [Candidatus Anaerobiospirillum stercoravium]|nr:hypothetical protein [Candidatus Anaerobiospirillum stercoravium]